jgi:hypothetical protein
MKKYNTVKLYLKTKWIFLSTLLISFSLPSLIHASFLGPLALLSLPSGIQSIISMKQFSKIKKELIKLLPHIAMLLIALSLVLLLIFFIIFVIYARKIYRELHRRRMKNYSQLLHSLLLELSLKKEIQTSSFLDEISKKTQRREFRNTLGRECSNLIDQALERLRSGTVSAQEQEHIISRLIHLIVTRIVHYS